MSKGKVVLVSGAAIGAQFAKAMENVGTIGIVEMDKVPLYKGDKPHYHTRKFQRNLNRRMRAGKQRR